MIVTFSVQYKANNFQNKVSKLLNYSEQYLDSNFSEYIIIYAGSAFLGYPVV